MSRLFREARDCDLAFQKAAGWLLQNRTDVGLISSQLDRVLAIRRDTRGSNQQQRDSSDSLSVHVGHGRSS